MGAEKRKQKIFALVDGTTGRYKADAYDYGMIAVIVLSLVPLAAKTMTPFLTVLDKVTACLFIVDYLLRWGTADILMQRGKASFLLYPVTVMAIIDLLSILPSFLVLSRGLELLKVLRVVRAAKLLRYSKSFELVADVIRDQRAPLLAVVVLAVGYVLLSALIVFNVEPQTFDSFFDAVYWATMSLTTVGYGDIYPVTNAGQLITIISSFFGIAIVALPAGVITAGYVERLQREKRELWEQLKDEITERNSENEEE